MKLILIILFALFLSGINSINTNKIKRNIKFEKIIEELKNSVVMIDIQSDLQLFTEKTSNSRATGFIVDIELGLIATNKHVTRTSPTRHRINFYDGSVAKGTVVYYDFYHDFGLIQLDFMRDGSDYKNNEIYKNLKPVQFGSSYSLEITEELMLIGNNEGVNYSIKYGTVTELNIPDMNGLGSIIQTSFDRTGGSSGSPVWNKDGKVVAIHAMGDKIASFEVPIEYLKNALDKIKQQKSFNYNKAFTGVFFSLIQIYKFEKYINTNDNNSDDFKDLITNIKKAQRKGTTDPELIQVVSVIPNSPADGKIKSGDIILKINEKFVGNDLLIYENLLDENTSVNKNISITLFRFGTIITIQDFKLKSTEEEKIKSFLKISNTIIHPINFYVKTFFPLLPYKSGLFISQVGVSSPFGEISSDGQIIIQSLNSIHLNSLDDLIKALESNCDRTNIYIEAMDLTIGFPRYLSYSIDFGDLQDVYIYEMDEIKGGWNSRAISLKQCELDHSNNSNKKRKSFEEVDKKFYHIPRKMNEMRNNFLKYILSTK